MDLTGQHVVVIGGSSGMGLATAQAAARAGAAVTVAARDHARLDAALATLPGNCAAVATDVTDENAVAALFERVDALDHLVHTAASAPAPRPLIELPLAEARGLLDAYLGGVLAVVQHAVPRLRAGGSITLTSGIIATRPLPGYGLLAAGAAAIEGLVRGLAVELAPLRVNAVRPGSVLTPMWDGLPAEHREAAIAASAARTLTSTIGRPEDIAAANLFLMTNNFTTGATIPVDGGAALR